MVTLLCHDSVVVAAVRVVAVVVMMGLLQDLYDAMKSSWMKMAGRLHSRSSLWCALNRLCPRSMEHCNVK